MRRSLTWILTLLLLAACKTNPYTGRRQTMLISEDREIELGKEAWAEMTGPGSKVKLDTRPAWNDPLQRVGRAIAVAADKKEYDWEFKLIDAPKTANAWALPGGKIAFYTGIYPVLEDEDGMAIVMGHEVSHALLRHGGERISQSMITAGILAGAAISTRDNKNRGWILAGLGVGAGLTIKAYGRGHETEADRFGLMLAARAGYNPEAGIKVWQRMAKLSKGSSGPTFLSTHPSHDTRIENMQKWMPEAKALYEQSQKKPNKKLPVLPSQ